MVAGLLAAEDAVADAVLAEDLEAEAEAEAAAVMAQDAAAEEAEDAEDAAAVRMGEDGMARYRARRAFSRWLQRR